jgi:hypothetical protein
MAAAIVAGFFTYLCLRDGSVPHRGFVFQRDKTPIRYWLSIGLYTILTVGLVITGASLLFGFV